MFYGIGQVKPVFALVTEMDVINRLSMAKNDSISKKFQCIKIILILYFRKFNLFFNLIVQIS